MISHASVYQCFIVSSEHWSDVLPKMLGKMVLYLCLCITNEIYFYSSPSLFMTYCFFLPVFASTQNSTYWLYLGKIFDLVCTFCTLWPGKFRIMLPPQYDHCSKGDVAQGNRAIVILWSFCTIIRLSGISAFCKSFWWPRSRE